MIDSAKSPSKNSTQQHEVGGKEEKTVAFLQESVFNLSPIE